MTQHSAGILLYRYNEGLLQVMLSHPGGPFWVKKDTAAWSIPKGILENEETPKEAALREFKEETGFEVTDNLLDLGSVKQSSGKIITIFATEKSIDVSKVVSNTFEMEWPPKSGQFKEFPENDKAEWFDISTARKKIFKGQRPFLDALIKSLNYNEDDNNISKQLSFFD